MSYILRLTVALLTFLVISNTHAAEVILRLHQMLPAQALIPTRVLAPWAERIEAESDGRIKVNLYHSMELGGKPADLIDQTSEGIVDITHTLLSYSRERFPKAEVFELPFMVTNATATSMAFQEYYETYMRDDDSFKGLHVLAVHTHGPGVLSTKEKKVHKLEDLRRLRIRGPSRVVNGVFMSFGARPVQSPLTEIPRAIREGSIDGTVLPFEVFPVLKIEQSLPYHTEFSGDYGLYTSTFVFAMNERRYQALPADLQHIIDRNSGIDLAREFGQAADWGDKVGRDLALKDGHGTFMLSEAETMQATQASDQVIEEWYADMKRRGLDGKGLHRAAKKLLESYSRANPQ